MPFVIVVASLAALQCWINRVRGPRAQSPQWYAFTTTVAAALFLISGSVGYKLQKGPPLVSDARWADGVIWPQVWVGLAWAVVAVFCWRRAMGDTERRLSGA
jgi:peptidoglycan/LPS O-acetylase OafA/YrhL